ncbi:Uncharacterized protein APZ42_021339 [Daphnia magna]|uniref:Uncharacterized protein n=1 Tax=Daphnia magna TaxID=35525 RepID=A0A164WRU7_9CRUS|nr:Uncharacterized protein APZ42_021339 [Daphnia magna]
MFSWFDTLKILILSIIGFIVFILCLRIFILCDRFTRIVEKIRQSKRLRRYGISMEEAHELTSMTASSNIQIPDEIVGQPFTRMTDPTPLTMERLIQLLQANKAHQNNAVFTPLWKKIGNRIKLAKTQENTQRAIMSWVME